MTIDWWGLGLQAINVLILVWLLGRVFWRPLAAAITRRQEAAQAMLDDGKAAQDKADAALADVLEARAGITSEREAILAEAKETADTATKAALKDAQTRADDMIAAASATIDHEKKKAQTETEARAAELSVEIAAHLLGPFNTAEVQATFLRRFVEAMADISDTDRTALTAKGAATRIITATELADTQKTGIAQAMKKTLGPAPTALQFVTDPDLIAGVELHSAHFVLHNSWRADLASILKEMKNVG